MGARTSEYTAEEANRHLGKRFRVTRESEHFSIGTVLEATEKVPSGDGYALFMEVVHYSDTIESLERTMTLTEVRNELEEW